MRRLGWHPSRPDPRDFLFAPPKKWTASLPKVHSNRHLCSKVEDQGTVGSCTGNAAVGLLEALINKEILLSEVTGTKTPKLVDLSRLFVYYYAHKLGGYAVSEDGGAQIRDCLKALAKYGVCPEELHPYGETEPFWAKRPSAVACEAAKLRQILNYYRLDTKGAPTARALESVLVQGYLIEFGFSVPENFEEDVEKNKGAMSVPGRSTKYDGGHAVALVGYDEERRLFEVRNSWGEGWGDKGYFWMPYEAVLNSGISDDFWFITRSELG